MSTNWNQEQMSLAEELIQKALEFGADLAGLASVKDLINGPSELCFPKIKDHVRDHFAEQITTGLPHGMVKWEEEQTILVFAVSHPKEKPEMDWWVGEINPPGNKILAQIARKLKEYLQEHYPNVKVYPKPYHIEKGGIYLKDAAVAAGLGCVGKNNLLVTPEFGPRVRLRAIGLSVALPSANKLEFDPCADCTMPCRAACPQNAFAENIYTAEEIEIPILPARDGTYCRKACAVEMELNENTAPLEQVAESEEPMPVIRYCRACEFFCRIGR